MPRLAAVVGRAGLAAGLVVAVASTPARAGPGPGGGGFALPITFDLSAFGATPTVSGLFGVTTGRNTASGTFELGDPGPGPIQPVDATAAVLLDASAGAAPEGLVIFHSGAVFGFPHPAQINEVTFDAIGAPGCATLQACVPAGIDAGSAVLTGGLQDISASFEPTFTFFDNDGLDVQIMVDLPRAVPEPPSFALLALGCAGLLLLRRTRDGRYRLPRAGYSPGATPAAASARSAGG